MSKEPKNPHQEFLIFGAPVRGQTAVLDFSEDVSLQIFTGDSSSLTIATSFQIMDVIVRAAVAIGHELPTEFFLTKGQIFYKDQRVEEVRLQGASFTTDENGKNTTVVWETPVAPRVDINPPLIELAPEDAERTHVTAFRFTDPNRPELKDEDLIFIKFDLEGNSSPGLTLKKSPDREVLKNPRRLTFIEARTMATAISDGTDLRNWKGIEGALAMLHATKDRKGKEARLQTRFEPSPALLGCWGAGGGGELSQLQEELKRLDFESLLQFLTVLGGVLESDLLRITVTIDDIIEAIGRGTDARRSKEVRAHWRQKVWRALLTFDSMSVVGMRNGIWREPRDGAEKRARMDVDKLHSKDALLKIIGQRGTADEQGTLDNSSPPKEVTITAGPWIEEFRGNREVLADFGHIRAIAAIPRGKPSGAWAACIGLMLQQYWREGATHATLKRVGEEKHSTLEFDPFTRRELLVKTWRSAQGAQSVSEILEGNDPQRAKRYWDEAIKLLKEAKIIGFCREIIPLEVSPYGWQEAWLDQPLDIRPGDELLQRALTIHNNAQVARKRSSRSSTTKKKA